MAEVAAEDPRSLSRRVDVRRLGWVRQVSASEIFDHLRRSPRDYKRLLSSACSEVAIRSELDATDRAFAAATKHLTDRA